MHSYHAYARVHGFSLIHSPSRIHVQMYIARQRYNYIQIEFEEFSHQCDRLTTLIAAPVPLGIGGTELSIQLPFSVHRFIFLSFYF